MEKNTNAEKMFPFFKILRANLLLIILITILCGLIGTGYAVMKDKPVYTASCSAVFRASLSGSQNAANDAQNTASLGKIYLPMVKDAMTSPAFIEDVNKELQKQSGYEDASVNAGRISFSTKDESLIFGISYSDANEEDAIVKLKTIYAVAETGLAEYFPAKDVSITSTNKSIAVAESRGFVQYVVMGVIAGIVIGIVIAMLRYVLDNTLHDQEDLEEITGVRLIACIEKSGKNN